MPVFFYLNISCTTPFSVVVYFLDRKSNKRNTMLKILIVDKPVVIPVILQALGDFSRESGEIFEPIVAVSAIQAEAYLLKADILIIDLADHNREMASIAVNELQMPVLAMSALPHDKINLEIYNTQMNRFRFLAKPEFDLKKFRRALWDFCDIAHEHASIAFTM